MAVSQEKLLPASIPLSDDLQKKKDGTEAASNSALSPPVPVTDAPKSKITFLLFVLNFLFEWACAFSPLLRVFASDPYQATRSSTESELIESVLLGWLRIVWCVVLAYRQNGRDWWKLFFSFDPVLGRSLVFSIGYAGILVDTHDFWYAAAIITDFGYTTSFAGIVRTMLKGYDWTPRTRRAYVILRAATPVLYLGLGAWFVLAVASGVNRNLFVFYLLVGVSYLCCALLFCLFVNSPRLLSVRPQQTLLRDSSNR